MVVHFDFNAHKEQMREFHWRHLKVSNFAYSLYTRLKQTSLHFLKEKQPDKAVFYLDAAIRYADARKIGILWDHELDKACQALVTDLVDNAALMRLMSANPKKRPKRAKPPWSVTVGLSRTSPYTDAHQAAMRFAKAARGEHTVQVVVSESPQTPEIPVGLDVSPGAYFVVPDHPQDLKTTLLYKATALAEQILAVETDVLLLMTETPDLVWAMVLVLVEKYARKPMVTLEVNTRPFQFQAGCTLARGCVAPTPEAQAFLRHYRDRHNITTLPLWGREDRVPLSAKARREARAHHGLAPEIRVSYTIAPAVDLTRPGTEPYWQDIATLLETFPNLTHRVFSDSARPLASLDPRLAPFVDSTVPRLQFRPLSEAADWHPMIADMMIPAFPISMMSPVIDAMAFGVPILGRYQGASVPVVSPASLLPKAYPYLVDETGDFQTLLTDLDLEAADHRRWREALKVHHATYHAPEVLMPRYNALFQKAFSRHGIYHPPRSGREHPTFDYGPITQWFYPAMDEQLADALLLDAVYDDLFTALYHDVQRLEESRNFLKCYIDGQLAGDRTVALKGYGR